MDWSLCFLLIEKSVLELSITGFDYLKYFPVDFSSDHWIVPSICYSSLLKTVLIPVYSPQATWMFLLFFCFFLLNKLLHLGSSNFPCWWVVIKTSTHTGAPISYALSHMPHILSFRAFLFVMVAFLPQAYITFQTYETAIFVTFKQHI